ncbi:hypothetical protein EV424DRAFT_1348892 [Suillus variegatus]|nr:hypothetical protein EV424DRAFT_1348892 [Suillus variegatus]
MRQHDGHDNAVDLDRAKESHVYFIQTPDEFKEENACDNPWDILSHIVVYSNSKSHLLESTTIGFISYRSFQVSESIPDAPQSVLKWEVVEILQVIRIFKSKELESFSTSQPRRRKSVVPYIFLNTISIANLQTRPVYGGPYRVSLSEVLEYVKVERTTESIDEMIVYLKSLEYEREEDTEQQSGTSAITHDQELAREVQSANRHLEIDLGILDFATKKELCTTEDDRSRTE